MVTCADLVHGERNDGETEDGVEIVLSWAALGVLGFHVVDKRADSALGAVEAEEDDTGFLDEILEREEVVYVPGLTL